MPYSTAGKKELPVTALITVLLSMDKVKSKNLASGRRFGCMNQYGARSCKYCEIVSNSDCYTYNYKTVKFSGANCSSCTY